VTTARRAFGLALCAPSPRTGARRRTRSISWRALAKSTARWPGSWSLALLRSGLGF